MAKRIVDEFWAGNGAQRWRGSWVQLNPFDVELDLSERAAETRIAYRIEALDVTNALISVESETRKLIKAPEDGKA